MTEYVEFHCRSAFSFLEGASLPEDLAQRAADLGHTALALTDRDNLCGAPRFYMAAKKLGQRRTSARKLPARMATGILCSLKIAPVIGICAG